MAIEREQKIPEVPKVSSSQEISALFERFLAESTTDAERTELEEERDSLLLIVEAVRECLAGGGNKREARIAYVALNALFDKHNMNSDEFGIENSEDRPAVLAKIIRFLNPKYRSEGWAEVKPKI